MVQKTCRIPERQEAVYLGIEGYGTVDAADKEDFIHRFAVNGDTLCYRVRSDEHFSLQNALMEGYIYDISVAEDTVCAIELLDRDSDNVAVGTVTDMDGETITVQKEGRHAGRSITNFVTLALSETTAVYSITAAAGGAAVERCAPAAESVAVGDTVKVIIGSAPDETEPGDASDQNDEASVLQAQSIYKTFVAEAYEPAVTGTPDTLTLDNFLALALEPVGTALYIYGGAWDWQDKYSSNQAMTVGIPQTWIDFFQAQDDTFSYIDREDPAHSYYPHNSWNQYYYAGADCSGYVGWVLYNLVNTEDSDVAHSNGFVEAASEIARSLSDKGWGSWRADTADGFGPGDIVSLSGHVWISLGTCADGSVVLLHATPSASHSGAEGGGIQISALDRGDRPTVKPIGWPTTTCACIFLIGMSATMPSCVITASIPLLRRIRTRAFSSGISAEMPSSAIRSDLQTVSPAPSWQSCSANKGRHSIGAAIPPGR